MNEILDGPSIEISLANDLREIAGTAGQIDAFCESHELASQIAYAVNLSIDEILSYTIIHGYDDDEPRRIELIVRLEGETLVAIIVDDSRAFDPSLVSQPVIEPSIEDRDLGGLGLYLVQQMMDGVGYRRTDGCNIVTLTKNTAAGEAL